MKQARIHVHFLSIIFITFFSLAFQHLLNPSVLLALPIETDTALTVGFESNALRSFGRVIHKTDLLKDGDEISDPEDREVTVFATPLIIPLRIKPNLMAIGILPILTIEAEKNVRKSHREFGLRTGGYAIPR